MANSVARDIIEALTIRMKALDLSSNNEIFFSENIPATIRDKSFTARWLDGSPDVDGPGVNRKVRIERNLEIKVYYKSLKTHSGSMEKATLLEAYDNEQEIFANLMTTRLTSGVKFESLVSTSVEPETINGTEWLVNEMIVVYKYEVNV